MNLDVSLHLMDVVSELGKGFSFVLCHKKIPKKKILKRRLHYDVICVAYICEVIFIIFLQLLPLHAMERKKRAGWMCGDGEVQPLNGEDCDDGNRLVTDECVGRSRDPSEKKR